MIIMGMTAFELFGVLRLDRKDFDSGLDEAKTKASGLGGTLMSVAGKGAGMLGSGLMTAAKVGAAAIGTATTAAVAFGKQSIDTANSFESAFTGVRKTVDETEEGFSELSSWIMEASTRMASSKEAIAGTMEVAGQLGVTGVGNLEKFTETMIMLGDTTNIEAEDAAGKLAKFVNITGDGYENIDRLGSVIVDLGNNFATSENDIVQMATRLASAGKIAGLSGTEIMALSTAMSSVGINAEAGGTAMATSLQKIGRAVDTQSEALELYAATAGMSAEEFSQAWKNEPIKAVQAFVGGLGEMNEANESTTLLLDDLGIKGIREVNTLQSLALASDVMTNAIDTANNAYEQNVALQNEANTRYGTTESQIMQTTEAFKNLQVMVGEKLKPTYQDFLGFSGEAMKAISEGLETGGLTGMMEAVGQAVADGLAKITEILPTAVDAGMQLLGALADGIAANAPAIFSALGQIADQIGGKLVELMQMALTNLEGMDFKAATDQLLQTLGTAFTDGSAGEFLQIGAEIIGQLIRGLVESAQALLEHAGDIVLWISNGIAAKLPTLVPTAVKMIAELLKGLTNPSNLVKVVQAAGVLIVSLAQGLMNALPTLLNEIPIIISNLVGALLAAIPQLLSVGIQLLVSLYTGFIGAIPSFLAAVPMIITGIIGGLVQGISALAETGGQLVSGFVKGISDAWNGMVGNIIEFFNGFIKRVKELFGVHSPSTVFLSIGTDLVQGLINGIQEMLGALREKAEEIVNQFKDLPEKMIEVGSNIVHGIWDGISSGYDWIVGQISGWVSNVIAYIKSAFKISSPSKIMRDQVGVWIGRGVAVGITQSLPDVQDAMDSMTDLIETPDLSATVAMSPVSQYSNYNEDDVAKREAEQEIFVDSLANAIVDAFVRADVGVTIDDREFGRLVRKVVPV